MLNLIKQLFSLLTSKQRKRFYVLQVLVVIMAFSEIIGVASIVPFMALVGDISLLQQDTLIKSIYNASGVKTDFQFLFLLGIGVLAMLCISAVVSALTTWRLSMFAEKIGTEIADRLYQHYLKQDWLFHATGSSAQLTKQISNETIRVTNQVLLPLMHMNARVVLTLMMSVGLFAFDPLVAIIGLSAFALAYLILYKLVRKKLHQNGQIISRVTESRFRLMNEGFGGIKDVLLLGRDEDFISRFNATGTALAHTQGTNSGIAHIPRYFMELVAFGSVISLVLYLIASHQGQLGAVLPILSVYALAGFKLLPAFQNIYFSIAGIKGNISAFESIKQDLIDSTHTINSPMVATQHSPLSFKRHITLKDINFTYPNKPQPALDKINLSIPVNSVTGIVGSSGSGKSTLIDLILGLIQAQHGEFCIDNTPITDQNRRLWQSKIGFVPQSIFLSEGTIAENIAFGIPQNKINLNQVRHALTLAHLDDLVQTLDQNIHTTIGERGIQLSGGQRQRIGIARALYHEAEALIFDEATSALDGITERLIMEAIHDFAGKKTIIMVAHRLKTIQKCDNIFLMDKGQVIAQGTYQHLVKTNEVFKRMTMHA